MRAANGSILQREGNAACSGAARWSTVSRHGLPLRIRGCMRLRTTVMHSTRSARHNLRAQLERTLEVNLIDALHEPRQDLLRLPTTIQRSDTRISNRSS